LSPPPCAKPASRVWISRLLPTVDSLKIDGSFVVGLGRDSGDEAIVSGTIDLARALDLKVVAEGVETAEQFARLEALGCDLAQGTHFAAPPPAGEASKLLANDHNHW
jgi:EAL domain-containing protein (putative c-di-GMP-specific phosphodiesterase class I)